MISDIKLILDDGSVSKRECGGVHKHPSCQKFWREAGDCIARVCTIVRLRLYNRLFAYTFKRNITPSRLGYS